MNEAVDDPTADDPGERNGPAATDPADSTVPDAGGPGEIDLVGIESDLDGVQAALARLADGTYWTDEVTGEPIPADVLDVDPLARRA
ncbi:MAG: hypothetical protein ABJH68_05560 [Ilumatobacter sp.]|uniref:hypothetical protein n=1 Tax=Ilumatobacter sp. TaxID=1967498 RepID=UPI0032996885